MRRNPLPLLCGAFIVATAVAVGRNLAVPRTRTASRAEILAVLPAALREMDAPDPAGEARYARLVAFVDPIFRTAEAAELETEKAKTPLDKAKIEAARRAVVGTLPALETLLDEGGWRTPVWKAGALFPEDAKFRALAKAIAACAQDAAARGDRAECARLLALDLRFGGALTASKGALVDEFVGIATEGVAERAAVEAARAGGLDAAGRRRVLAQMPELRGPMPELGDALRRDFVVEMMPVLTGTLDEVQRAYADDDRKRVLPQGTWDAVDTARLMGRVDAAEIADTRVPFRKQRNESVRIAEAAGEGLPDIEQNNLLPDGIERFWWTFKYRLAMNAQPNTIGRGLVRDTTFSIGATGVRRAAARNLARAAILLIGGERATVGDPYGDGPLREDPKRKIVWSVGKDGKDDGGQIGKNGGPDEPDYGYAYRTVGRGSGS